ncbi:hypothetical protein [Pseudomonas sp. GV071]|uniref:hypothetical protein n=1 Tax=Pseudomonas sp. GV071 TaxID=2135754 RepID=UPI000D3DC92D|nr:hypothetical protein [Pseudomonas sp. GV071]PTQ71602.1 hypothetical protein C8K61_104154 [Pseudomonas sp. GV071]
MFEIKSRDGRDYPAEFFRAENSWRNANDQVANIFLTWRKLWQHAVGDYATFWTMDMPPRVAEGTVLSKPFWLSTTPVQIGEKIYARVDIICTRITDEKNFQAGAFLVNENGDVFNEDGELRIDTIGTPQPYVLLLFNVLKTVLDAKV